MKIGQQAVTGETPARTGFSSSNQEVTYIGLTTNTWIYQVRLMWIKADLDILKALGKIYKKH